MNPFRAASTVSAVTLLGVALTGCGEPTQTSSRDSDSNARAAADTDTNTEPSSLLTEYESTAAPDYVLAHTLARLEGEEESLETYKGKVVLIVNTASKCGYTPQYDGLQKLYEDRKADGLVVLGFPSDNFGGQEFDTNEQVAEFCRANYGVEFPMFAKVDVKGDTATPLFKQLAEQAGGEPRWNFTKYLVNREGKVVAKFDSGVKPDSAELRGRIDALLKG